MMKRKPKILLFFYRFMEFRLFFQTGMLDELAKSANPIVVVPAKAAPSVQQLVGEQITVVSTSLGKSTVLEEFGGSGFQASLARFFALIYATNRDASHNITAKLHLTAIQANANSTLKKWKFSALKLATSIVSRYLFLRHFIQFIFRATNRNEQIAKIISRYKPDLVVTGSFGVSSDGLVLLEAQRKNILTAVVLQSWDRTSSKGYPTVTPDHVIVWSDVTANETNQFLDIPSHRIYVDGAPLWDEFFRDPCPISRKSFYKMFGMNINYPFVVLAMNSLAYHQGNLDVIKEIANKTSWDKAGTKLQILIRLHPSYFSADREKKEMEELVSALKFEKHVFIDRPRLVSEEDGLLFTKEDQKIQASSFYHCLLTISCVSTYMIESSIFNKPAINQEFGRWHTNLYDIDLSEYKVQHLQRIYDYGAVYRISSLDELLPTINHIAENPTERAAERKKLIDVEIPINRGTAGNAYCTRLLEIALAK